MAVNVDVGVLVMVGEKVIDGVEDQVDVGVGEGRVTVGVSVMVGVPVASAGFGAS